MLLGGGGGSVEKLTGIYCKYIWSELVSELEFQVYASVKLYVVRFIFGWPSWIIGINIDRLFPLSIVNRITLSWYSSGFESIGDDLISFFVGSADHY